MTSKKTPTVYYAVYKPATISGVSLYLIVGWFDTLDKAILKSREMADGSFVQEWSNPK